LFYVCEILASGTYEGGDGGGEVLIGSETPVGGVPTECEPEEKKINK
jgi:hypothetical protein